MFQREPMCSWEAKETLTHVKHKLCWIHRSVLMLWSVSSVFSASISLCRQATLVWDLSRSCFNRWLSCRKASVEMQECRARYDLGGETWLQRHQRSVLTQSYHRELVDLLPQSRALVLHSDVLVLLFYLLETNSGSGLLCSFTKMQSVLFNQFFHKEAERCIFTQHGPI